jgi:hypothetical protein
MTTVKKTTAKKPVVATITNGAVLSADTLLQTTNVVANDIEVANKWKKLSDLYIADGFTSKMLELDNKSYEDTHNKIKTAILMAFDQQSRDLMAKFEKSKIDPKSKLSQFEQGIKDHLVRQIGSKYGKIITHIKNAETSDQIKDKTKGATTKKAPKDNKKKVAHYLDLAIRTMQSMTNPEIGVSTDIKTLQVIESKYKTAK